MNTESERLIYGLHRQGQDKVTYFLLAAAGASIAFGLSQTRADTLAWPHVLLGLALIAWAWSILQGLRHIWQTDSILQGNMELIRIQTGRHPDLGANPQNIAWGSGTLGEVLEKSSARSQRYARQQFAGLAVGAGFYICWHVLEMYLRGLA